MKYMILASLLTFAVSTLAADVNATNNNEQKRNVAQASIVTKGKLRSDKEATIKPERVSQLYTLVDKKLKNSRDLKVRVVVINTGGATDVSPQLEVYFGLYSENEMADFYGTYKIGSAYKVISARRTSGGMYEIKGNFNTDDPTQVSRIKIDATDAVNQLESMKCGEFSVCEVTAPININ